MLNDSVIMVCLMLDQKQQATHVLKFMEKAGASFDKGEFRTVIGL